MPKLRRRFDVREVPNTYDVYMCGEAPDILDTLARHWGTGNRPGLESLRRLNKQDKFEIEYAEVRKYEGGKPGDRVYNGVYAVDKFSRRQFIVIREDDSPSFGVYALEPFERLDPNEAKHELVQVKHGGCIEHPFGKVRKILPKEE